jgi:hypothetical protein
MDQSVEWHYIDTENAQKGPLNAAELREEWRKGRVDAQCIVWNPSMADWQEVETLADLKAYLSFA